MSSLDLVVIGSIAVAAAWPLLTGAVRRIAAASKPRPAAPPAVSAAGSTTEDWRQAWASTFISLIEEIESGESHFEDDKAALRLAKELLWEVIGGDGQPPSKAK